jgi:hypothetical protein
VGHNLALPGYRRKILEPASPPLPGYNPDMDNHLTQYELDVLRSHRDRPQATPGHEDRREAQNMLAGLRYLTKSEDGTFSITSLGLKRLAKAKT